MNGTHGATLRRLLTTPSGLALLGILAVTGYWLWTEHEAHVVAALPYTLLLGCLVMHLFMRGGHGAKASEDDRPNGRHDHGDDSR